MSERVLGHRAGATSQGANAMTERIAFVTGASTGIGFETARALRSAGFIVYAGARRVEKMHPLKAQGITVMHRMSPSRTPWPQLWRLLKQHTGT